MSTAPRPAVTLHHRTFTIDTPSWTAAYTTGRVADLDDALLSFDGALHDHVRRLDRLTVVALFIRARCGALWSDRPHTGIFDTRDGADDSLAVRFNREFVAVGFTDPRYGDCVIVMDATLHGYHLPVAYRQRPGVDWRWLHAVTLRCPARTGGCSTTGCSTTPTTTGRRCTAATRSSSTTRPAPGCGARPAGRPPT
jgi:hypothetical protein